MHSPHFVRVHAQQAQGRVFCCTCTNVTCKAQVRVGVVKRCKNVKSDVPLEVHANCSALQRKLQEQPGWDAHATTVSNYKQTRFAHSSNKHVAALSTDAPGAGASTR